MGWCLFTEGDTYVIKICFVSLSNPFVRRVIEFLAWLKWKINPSEALPEKNGYFEYSLSKVIMIELVMSKL